MKSELLNILMSFTWSTKGSSNPFTTDDIGLIIEEFICLHKITEWMLNYIGAFANNYRKF